MTETKRTRQGDAAPLNFVALRRAALFGGLVAAVVCVAISPADANDSSASLHAGGLQLTFNTNIQLESEDLFISREQVRVSYRFHNTSGQDISTLVAFPLPVMEIGEGGNYVLHGKDPINVMDFQVTVDGQRVEPSVEAKATRFGVDVTELLRRHNVPLTMRDGDNLDERLNRLPANDRIELEQYGVIDWNTTFDVHNTPSANVHWNTHISFYWFQTFPAGRTIEVTHQYRPVPRHFFFADDDLASAEMQKAYCIDSAFARSARMRIQQAPETLLAGYELKYVLTTAGNWLGPIWKFRLTVEKSSTEALVSLCAPGIKPAGPTSYVQTQDDYVPSDDLKILFVEPIDPAN